MRHGVGNGTRGSLGATHTSLIKSARSSDTRGTPLRQDRGGEECQEGNPEHKREDSGKQPGDPGSGGEGSYRGGSGHDDTTPTSGGALRHLSIIGDPRQGAHRDPMALDTPRLVVIVTSQPHGDEYGGPQGNDRHIDQTRHINER